mgnify:CR=1 FL=1
MIEPEVSLYAIYCVAVIAPVIPSWVVILSVIFLMLVVEISSCVKNGLHDGVVWYAKFLSLNGPNLVGSVTLNLILDALILVGLICADVVVTGHCPPVF